HIKAYGKYFCSQNCVEKYAKQKGLKTKKNKSEKIVSSCCGTKANKWYKDKLFIVSVITIILFTVSYLVPALTGFYDALVDYAKIIWWAVLLGFLIGGLIDYFVPQEYIVKYLGRHNKRSILYAVLFGFLMSACSHGILAIAIALYKKGANTSSVIAFLLASPWANLPITILFFGLFGTKALFIVFSAIFVAITTGFIYQALERRGKVECDKCQIKLKNNFSVLEDLKKRLKADKTKRKSFKEIASGVLSSSWSLTKMVGWWLLIGMVVASLARAFVPQHFFMTYMGPTFLGMVVVLVLATIIEVCSEGSAPMAFEIFKQTGAFGNAFTFLMAGVATDYTEIGLIWTNIGKKAAMWLPLITVPQILILGWLFNIFL
ncbi:permease, partial [Nanoarchaeota archaeon]